jgi:hypothetical protein
VDLKFKVAVIESELMEEERTRFVEAVTKQLRVAKSTETTGRAETLAEVVGRLRSGSNIKMAS